MHLWNILQLRSLDGISRKMDVSFVVHGGVAFRYALKRYVAKPSSELLSDPFDLFDLAPFSSDIDILHSGPASKTSLILDAIRSQIPFADCFRWELRSQKEQFFFDELKQQGNCIPARSLSISNIPLQSIHDPMGGLKDIQTGQYRFVRPGKYRDSVLYKNGRDIDAFGALLYLQTLFEAALTEEEILKQSAMSEIEAILSQYTENNMRNVLERNAYLPSRLTYLLTNMMTTAPNGSILKKVAAKTKLDKFVESFCNINSHDYNVFNSLTSSKHQDSMPVQVLSSSAKLSDSNRRIPISLDSWSIVPADKKTFEDGVEFANDHRPLLVSQNIKFEKGKAGSAAPFDRPSCTNEFMYFSLYLNDQMSDAIDGYGSESLSCVVLLDCGDQKEGWVPYIVPCIVRKRNREFLDISINCYGYLANYSQKKVQMKIYLLGLEN